MCWFLSHSVVVSSNISQKWCSSLAWLSLSLLHSKLLTLSSPTLAKWLLALRHKQLVLLNKNRDTSLIWKFGFCMFSRFSPVVCVHVVMKLPINLWRNSIFCAKKYVNWHHKICSYKKVTPSVYNQLLYVIM